MPIAEEGPLSLRSIVLPVRESDDIVWVSLGAPAREPPTLVNPGRGWTRFLLTQAFEAPFDQVVENFMDSGHTGIVHRGLIRSPRRVAREVRIERSGDSVLVTHLPCEEQIGVLRRLYGGGLTSHTDRFTLPATVEVRYDLGRSREFAALLYCSPTTSTTTTLFAAVALRLGPLNAIARWAVPWLARRVLKQDADIVRAVAGNLADLGWTPGFSPTDEMHRLVAELIAAGRAGEARPPPASRALRLWL